MYIVYCHTSKTSGKKYIGYTKFSLSERLKKHHLNALSGVDTHFYRAIRLYGLEDFSSEILHECYSQEEASSLEKYFIGLFNTYKNGYNQTLGGDGGNTIAKKTEEEIKILLEDRSKNSTRERNGRWSGYSDEEILSSLHEFFKNKPGSSISQFIIETGFPKSYSKNRFDGIGLRKAYCLKYNVEIKKTRYKVSEKHRENLSLSFKGRNWYSNDDLKISKQMYEKDATEGWKKGRKYGYKNRKIIE